jgi:hypothetical protein
MSSEVPKQNPQSYEKFEVAPLKLDEEAGVSSDENAAVYMVGVAQSKWRSRARRCVIGGFLVVGVILVARIVAPEHTKTAFRSIVSLFSDVQECTFKSQNIPCFGHRNSMGSKFVMAEYDVAYMPTVAANGTYLGRRELESYGSTHEILSLPNGQLLISHQTTNSIIRLQDHNPDVFAKSQYKDAGERTKFGKVLNARHILPSGSGIHGMRVNDKGPKRNESQVWLIQEFSGTIQLYDYLNNAFVATWTIPWQQAGVMGGPNPERPSQAYSHTLVLDSQGHIYFTMKNSWYNKSTGPPLGKLQYVVQRSSRRICNHNSLCEPSETMKPSAA